MHYRVYISNEKGHCVLDSEIHSVLSLAVYAVNRFRHFLFISMTGIVIMYMQYLLVTYMLFTCIHQ